MSGLLPAELREALAAIRSQAPEIVVPDPYLAQALQAETGYEKFIDIYTWAVERLQLRKPNPLDLLKAYQAALSAIGLTAEGSFAELWEAAQRMGRDQEEVMRGVESMEHAGAFWQALTEHRLIQQTFQLYDKDTPPAWLKALPFPYHSPRHTRTFWEKLPDFIRAYKESLRQQGGTFAEEALHRLRHLPGDWRNVVFLHIYSIYPSVRLLLEIAPARGARIWNWDTEMIRAHLPGIWELHSAPDRRAAFTARAGEVTFHQYLTLLEVVESAAEAIAARILADPDARIAVWCEGENAALLRFLLEVQYGLTAVLSPPTGSIAESTRVGRQLLPHIKSGLQGQLSTWPPVEADSDDPAERWAALLYETVQAHGSPASGESWRFLLKLLQSEAPQSKAVFSPDTRIYIGRLPQLAGGRYDALFMIEPPAEPLGRWMRPSFWVASLRRRFSPPEHHHQMAWRLLSLLLWGSEQIYLFRRSDKAYLTPVEEFLRHTGLFGTAGRFHSPNLSPAPALTLPSPRPVPLQASFTWVKVSPSLLGQLIVCPRRAWWGQVFRERPSSEAALLGQLLHEIIARAFTPPAFVSLRRIGYRLSRRRLFYRVGLHRRHKRWRSARRTLRPLLADAGQPVLQTLLHMGTGTTPQSRRRLHWYHLCAYRDIRCKPRAEQNIQHATMPIHGRVDLLIEVLNACTGETRRVLLDFKPSVYKESSSLPGILTALEEGIAQLEARSTYRTPEKFRDVVFQLIVYVWMLEQMGITVDTAALVALWWRPATSPGKESRLPYEIYDPREIVQMCDTIEGGLLRLITYLQTARSQEDFPMTEERRHCTYCDFALLCDRLS